MRASGSGGGRAVKPLRLLAVIEAHTLTGPAKGLLQFAATARSAGLAHPVEVVVATYSRPGASRIFAGRVRELGIPLYEMPERRAFDLSVPSLLADLVRSVAPDVLQTHAVKSHFLVRASRLHRAVPWVAFHHGYTWPTCRVRLYNQLDRWSFRAARRVLTVSRGFERQLTGLGVPLEKIEVIPNAVEPGPASSPADVAALRERWRLPPHVAVVLLVGRLSREKDAATLIRAIAAIDGLRPGLRPHAVLVGDGPERAPLERLAAALGVRLQVTFTGQQPSAWPFYALAQVLALSSLSEGSPNALLEAMAARVPIVATSVGGIPEMVRDGHSAILIPPSDPAALARALVSLLSDRPLAATLCDHAAEAIRLNHSPLVRTERLCELYRQTLAGRGRAAVSG